MINGIVAGRLLREPSLISSAVSVLPGSSNLTPIAPSGTVEMR